MKFSLIAKVSTVNSSEHSAWRRKGTLYFCITVLVDFAFKCLILGVRMWFMTPSVKRKKSENFNLLGDCLELLENK